MSDKTEYTLSSSPTEDEEDSEKRPCLVMIRGDFIGQVYELRQDVTMIGRSDDIDLVVSDTSISRRHAMIVRREDGFFLSDLGSTNGSFVNKEQVVDPLPLSEGDKVAIGHIVFKFTYQDDDDTEYHLMLRNMAVKDGLTRIYNKRYFNEVLEKECEYNRRNQVGLCLIIFDIDHFKQINDTWGHPAGDFILKNLAQLIENEARGYDVFARYGGEEFVFLLRGAPLEAAVQLAERVRKEVEEHVFSYDDVDLKITISLGVAYWSGENPMEDEELVEAADRHLYEAKEGGRNRTCQDPAS
ncbi:MAG: GGDEF domain-containing protein [Gammaproteobacteria bacterium]|jgi:two-component system, cell cycle response regulator|nr:GGDEF domain-containing protein [Gammaproteobacteria bacterium]MBT7370149.1 GGDEF domain-containing protein [Gammaproteobacteria bacterium]